MGMSGAPALTALGALRAGAGLVTMAVPRSIQPIVATLCPCATSIGLPETADGRIEPAAALRELRERGLAGERAPAAPDVLVTGMGAGRGLASHARAFWELINAFRVEACVPTVADADALNMLRGDGSNTDKPWIESFHPRTIMTPHPGELARMLGVSPRDIQSDRRAAVARALQRMSTRDPAEPQPVLVLKGAGTLVSQGQRLHVNRTGNAGMATGGTGDVLSGVIAALVAQKLDLFDAAVLGVHLHGLAGDRAARERGMISLIATDLLDFLPGALLSFSMAGRAVPRR